MVAWGGLKQGHQILTGNLRHRPPALVSSLGAETIRPGCVRGIVWTIADVSEPMRFSIMK